MHVWLWVKSNALFVAIAVALVATAFAFGHMRGHSAGKAGCEARYERAVNQQNQAVIERMAEINAENARLRAEWAKANQLASERAEVEIRTIYRTVEKVIEKPVPVSGPCDIDYFSVARVLDAVATGTENTRSAAPDPAPTRSLYGTLPGPAP